jgi:ribonucleoside-diphosphate reductase alpha chain
MAHVKMMAAVQPFLSGAISKTVNLPNDATVEDVANVYDEGWKLGSRRRALPRRVQGVAAALEHVEQGDEGRQAGAKARDSKRRSARARGGCSAPGASAKEERRGPRTALRRCRSSFGPTAARVRLPKRARASRRRPASAATRSTCAPASTTTGTLGEIFIDMHKEGAAFRSLMNCFAMAVSLGLQHGVPLEEFVDQFTFTRFEPQGNVEGHPNIKLATSIVDYIFRVLGMEYLQRYDLAHVKPLAAAPAFAQHPPGHRAQRRDDRDARADAAPRRRPRTRPRCRDDRRRRRAPALGPRRSSSTR